MIRLATQEDRTTIERLCAKEPWDGTEVMTAYLSRCADTAQVDWQYSDLWVGQSQTQSRYCAFCFCVCAISALPHRADLSDSRFPSLEGALGGAAPLFADAACGETGRLGKADRRL